MLGVCIAIIWQGGGEVHVRTAAAVNPEQDEGIGIC
jgi:hypothetical protein